MGIANTITCIRILLAPVLTIVLFVPGVPHNVLIAAVLFVFAIITDLIDGHLARAYKEASLIGGHLDGLADKLLWNLLLFAFVILGIVPFWFAAIIFTRDALATEFKSIAAIRGVKMAVTSFEGKAKVALQNIGVGFGFAAMLGQEYAVLPDADVATLLQVCMGCFILALGFGLVNFWKDVAHNAGRVLGTGK